MSNASLAEALRARADGIDMSVCEGCDACGLRCAEGVRMSRAEYDAVRDFVRCSPEPARIERVQAQGKDVDLGDGVYVRMCRYRDVDRGSCAVYAARPTICRLFGHVEWLPCPIGRVQAQIPAAEAAGIALRCAPEDRRTFEEWQVALPAAGLRREP